MDLNAEPYSPYVVVAFHRNVRVYLGEKNGKVIITNFIEEAINFNDHATALLGTMLIKSSFQMVQNAQVAFASEAPNVTL